MKKEAGTLETRPVLSGMFISRHNIRVMEFFNFRFLELLSFRKRLGLMALVLTLFSGLGCAISTESSNEDDVDVATGSRQHPSSYFIDRFQVQKEMPDRKNTNNVPFYFKKCSEAGENFPSRTSYECDYPF